MVGQMEGGKEGTSALFHPTYISNNHYVIIQAKNGHHNENWDIVYVASLLSTKISINLLLGKIIV